MQYVIGYKDNSLSLLSSSALGEIGLEVGPECWLIFALRALQGFLVASSVLEDQCEFSGSKVLAIKLIELASCVRFI